MFRSWINPGVLRNGRRLLGLLDRADFWTGAMQIDAPAEAPLADGFDAATLIATETGWVAAADLRPGDRVVTFDHGLQVLRRTGRAAPGTAAAAPLLVPAGALGNRRALTLLPGQSVLLDSDAAERLYGDPFALVPAVALDGWKGIVRAEPRHPIAQVQLEFDGDEIVYAEGMALVLCLRQSPLLVTSADELIAAGRASPYRALPPARARSLLLAMAGA